MLFLQILYQNLINKNYLILQHNIFLPKVMTTDEKILYKTRVLEVCSRQLLKTTENLKREMDDCQQMANDYGPPKDRYDAFRSQMLRKRDFFAEQMSKANQELAIISSIKPQDIKKKVEFGAFVMTEKQNYFVAASIGKIALGDDSFFCISPAVPLFKVLSGLKAGDTAKFNDNTITIKDIF